MKNPQHYRDFIARGRTESFDREVEHSLRYMSRRRAGGSQLGRAGSIIAPSKSSDNDQR